jgi:hypothetical protein
MNNQKESAKQISPEINPQGKYQEAIKSPLHNMKSKEDVINESDSDDE